MKHIISLFAICAFFLGSMLFNVHSADAYVCCSSPSDCNYDCVTAVPPTCSVSCEYNSLADKDPSPPNCSNTGGNVCYVTYNDCAEWGSWGSCNLDPNGKCYQTRFCTGFITIYEISQCDCGGGDGDDDDCIPSGATVDCGTQTCNSCEQCCLVGCKPIGDSCDDGEPPPPPPTITDFYIAKSLINMDKNATYTMNEETHIPFYIVLAMQMHIHKLPIKWLVLDSADTCTASCTYVDKQGVRLPDGAGQANDCQWHGTVNKFQGTQEVQPQHQGIVTYTLKCSNAYGSDTKTFQVGVKLFSWREVWRGIYNATSQFTTDTQFGFASVLDAIKAKLSSGQ